MRLGFDLEKQFQTDFGVFIPGSFYTLVYPEGVHIRHELIKSNIPQGIGMQNNQQKEIDVAAKAVTTQFYGRMKEALGSEGPLPFTFEQPMTSQTRNLYDYSGWSKVEKFAAINPEPIRSLLKAIQRGMYPTSHVLTLHFYYMLCLLLRCLQTIIQASVMSAFITSVAVFQTLVRDDKNNKVEAPWPSALWGPPRIGDTPSLDQM